MYYVYLLVSDTSERYIGYTSDLRKLFQQHNRGVTQSTKGKRGYLAYYEAYASKEDAMRRETRLKDGRAKHHLLRRVSRSLDFLGLK